MVKLDIRKGYSIRLTPSVYHRKHVKLSDSLHENLLCLAETDATVEWATVGGPVVNFRGTAGRTIRTSIAFEIVRAHTKKIEYWDSTWSSDEGDDQKTCEKRKYAFAVGVPYRLFRKSYFVDRKIEFDNRRTAQRLLYAGIDVSTRTLEAKILVTLHEASKTIGQLCDESRVPVSLMQLAVIRLWMRGLLICPFEQSHIQPGWSISCADGS